MYQINTLYAWTYTMLYVNYFSIKLGWREVPFTISPKIKYLGINMKKQIQRMCILDDSFEKQARRGQQWRWSVSTEQPLSKHLLHSREAPYTLYTSWTLFWHLISASAYLIFIYVHTLRTSQFGLDYCLSYLFPQHCCITNYPPKLNSLKTINMYLAHRYVTQQFRLDSDGAGFPLVFAGITLLSGNSLAVAYLR